MTLPPKIPEITKEPKSATNELAEDSPSKVKKVGYSQFNETL